MPELPEVQTVVATLAPRIVTRRIRGVELLRDDIVHPCGFDLAKALRSKTVQGVSRRGKRIVITLGGGEQFYVHLGMTGRLTIDPPSAQIIKHTHLILHFDGFDVRFRDPRRFGGVWWIGRDESTDKMGPEPLTLRPETLIQRLAKTRRVIKSALLDQNLIAGLGNIYVDEALFEAGIHPLSIANELSPQQVRRLNRAIKTTLRRAIRHRGSTLRDYVDADGVSGGFQKLHRVYDRKGQPCANCKTPLERIVIGARSTHFCPHCQRAPNQSPLPCNQGRGRVKGESGRKR
jgi:formamidopyrimidine-DNA glycosylase